MEEDTVKLTEVDSHTEQPKKIKKTTPKAGAKKAAVATKDPTKLARELKVMEYLEEFMTTGNGTQSAMKVFGLTDKKKAQDMSYYIQKTHGSALARMYMEKKGRGWTKMLDKAWEKMEDAKDPGWWDRLFKLQGYDDFLNVGKQAPTQTVNIMNVQKDIMKEYVQGEIVELPDEEDL